MFAVMSLPTRLKAISHLQTRHERRLSALQRGASAALPEFDFPYSNRSALEVSDVERTGTALRGITGNRLTYRPTNQARHA
jgi:hypothetical protein